jgi:hypothetical protein
LRQNYIIILERLSIGVNPYVVFLHTWFFAVFACIIGAMMKTVYTIEQIKEFLAFVAKHNLTFNNKIEVESAIAQYFLED